MKKLPLLAVAVATLALAACSKNAPGNTIERMQAEICSTGDPMVMQKYVSAKSQQIVSMMSMLMAEEAKAKQIKEQIKADCAAGANKVEILETKIDGDTATVRYRNGKGEEETAQLIKEDGEWKLHIEAPNK